MNEKPQPLCALKVTPMEKKRVVGLIRELALMLKCLKPFHTWADRPSPCTKIFHLVGKSPIRQKMYALPECISNLATNIA